MPEPDNPLSVLCVEDADYKFTEVEEVLKRLSIAKSIKIARASTVVQAESMIAQRWDLILMDISMDISVGSSGPYREGHANLGGLDLIEQMYLLETYCKIIIVTGFDYFMKMGSDPGTRDAHTIEDLEDAARQWMGDALIGCVRYGSVGWEDRLSSFVDKALA